MRFIYIGDIVGKVGRSVVTDNIGYLRRELNADFVVVNGENAAHGFGLTAKICQSLFDAGADVIVTGNHVWDQREILGYIDNEPRLLRPLNLPPGTPGRGVGVFEAPGGRHMLIAQIQGRLFMDPLDDPFRAIDAALAETPLGTHVQASLVDFHAEATSEKMAMGQFLDGRTSAVIGSHTHIPTADAHILPGGTAYQTDIGMCGDYDTVIGMDKRNALLRFTTGVPTERLEPGTGPATLCAAFVETDDATGLAVAFEPIRVGGVLRGAWPGRSRPPDVATRTEKVPAADDEA